MINTKILEDGDILTFSDCGKKIIDEFGNIYETAVDRAGVNKAYTEIDELIPEEEITEIEAYNEIMDILSE